MIYAPDRQRIPFYELRRFEETGELGPVMKIYESREALAEKPRKRPPSRIDFSTRDLGGVDGVGEGNRWVSYRRK